MGALDRLLRQLDESGLSKLIVEMVLLGSVESGSQDDGDTLTVTPSNIVWIWRKVLHIIGGTGRVPMLLYQALTGRLRAVVGIGSPGPIT
jgi:hypothetical protein